MKPDKALLKIKSRAAERNWEPYSPHYLAGKRFALYGEDYFLNMLHLERKRAERCRRPFCLMLLDLEKFSDILERRQVAKKIVHLLHSLTRETDLKGWYKYDSVMGVIYTETSMVDIDHMRNKMRQKLSKVRQMEKLNDIVITTYIFPEEGSRQEFDDSPDLTLYPDLSRQNPHHPSLVIKRAIDLVGSVLGLIIFSPLFLVIPLCIKITSEGPVFFRQERMGRYGKKFTFLKFRTMHTNNDPGIHKDFVANFICGQAKGGQGKVFKIKDDPRITPLGRILRKTSLDELPQFYNVLKGEMSLVGPRPPIPYEYESYDVWHKRRVIEIKPGITGLWQVRGRSSTNFDEMVRLDIKYMREWSLWMDIKIIMQTPLAILFGKGAY